jgi:hypothetical protein
MRIEVYGYIRRRPLQNDTKVVISSSPGPFDALTALSEVEGLTGGSSVFKDFLDSGSLAQTVIKKKVRFKALYAYIVMQLLFTRKSRQGGQVRNDG